MLNFFPFRGERFAPRLRGYPIDELLRGTDHPLQLDPQGSLVDADMGGADSEL
jgi:hypothetical protein